MVRLFTRFIFSVILTIPVNDGGELLNGYSNAQFKAFRRMVRFNEPYNAVLTGIVTIYGGGHSS